jgi:methionyl-tRNA formyltransferase
MTQLEGKLLKIFSAETKDLTGLEQTPMGHWQCDGKSLLQFRCADGWLVIKSLQLAGKKRMTTEEFLRGWKPTENQV